MNFDTRTVFDLMIVDPDLEIIINSLVDAEKYIYFKSGNTSENDFVRSVIPLVRDELKFYMRYKLHKLKLGFLNKMVDLDKVDYYHLIPAVCKI
jgi:hypothetical protein